MKKTKTPASLKLTFKHRKRTRNNKHNEEYGMLDGGSGKNRNLEFPFGHAQHEISIRFLRQVAKWKSVRFKRKLWAINIYLLIQFKNCSSENTFSLHF